MYIEGDSLSDTPGAEALSTCKQSHYTSNLYEGIKQLHSLKKNIVCKFSSEQF